MRRFFMFCVYFLIFVIAFYLRPGTDQNPNIETVRTNDGFETGFRGFNEVAIAPECCLSEVKIRLQFRIGKTG